MPARDLLNFNSPGGTIRITKSCNGISIDTTSTIPVGTTAQRPSSPIEPSLRYNTDTHTYEYWNGTEWTNFGSSSPESLGYMILGDSGDNLIIFLSGDNLILH